MNSPYFIAEIGVNHHGDFEKAKRMIEMAKASGAHVAKFQFYDPQAVLGANHPDLDYAMQCYLPKARHEELKKYCETVGIEYAVSVFAIKDVAWAASISSFLKIASRMNANQEFIAKVEEVKLPVVMSVQPGLSNRIPQRFNLMWCVRKYPTPKEEVLEYPYSKDFGLSSHCPDYTATVEAYKRGARLFENHVCEDKAEYGCDIAASISFEDYKRMRNEIAYLSKALVY